MVYKYIFTYETSKSKKVQTEVVAVYSEDPELYSESNPIKSNNLAYLGYMNGKRKERILYGGVKCENMAISILYNNHINDPGFRILSMGRYLPDGTVAMAAKEPEHFL